MPNQRRKGWQVSTYSAPVKLVQAAKAKARQEGQTVSAVIRDALERYVKKD